MMLSLLLSRKAESDGRAGLQAILKATTQLW